MKPDWFFSQRYLRSGEASRLDEPLADLPHAVISEVSSTHA